MNELKRFGKCRLAGGREIVSWCLTPIWLRACELPARPARDHRLRTRLKSVELMHLHSLTYFNYFASLSKERVMRG